MLLACASRRASEAERGKLRDIELDMNGRLDDGIGLTKTLKG